ncbi:MAG: PBPRA1643 family SWIM/SEC-C metal-binding motif protein [Chloroflexota bacterium]
MSLQSERRRQFGTTQTGSFQRTKDSELYKLGSQKRPLFLTVQSEERKTALIAICDDNGWQHQITVDADVDEDIAELEELQNTPEPFKAEDKVGRNDPCPCGSGKKYKQCHGKR